MLRRVVKMKWRFVERLQEAVWIISEPPCFKTRKISGAALQMFRNVERKNAVENSITKRKAMRAADDVSVAKDLMLEFDAIRVSHRGRAGADV